MDMGMEKQGLFGAPGEDRVSKTKTTSMLAAVASAIYAAAALAGYSIPIPQEAVIGGLGALLALGQYFLRRAL